MDNILEEIELYYYDMYKGKELVVQRLFETRKIKLTVVGFNKVYPDILIGLISDDSGVIGWNKVSRFDFVENESGVHNYTYFNVSLICPNKPAKIKKKLKPKN